MAIVIDPGAGGEEEFPIPGPAPVAPPPETKPPVPQPIPTRIPRRLRGRPPRIATPTARPLKFQDRIAKPVEAEVDPKLAFLPPEVLPEAEAAPVTTLYGIPLDASLGPAFDLVERERNPGAIAEIATKFWDAVTGPPRAIRDFALEQMDIVSAPLREEVPFIDSLWEFYRMSAEEMPLGMLMTGPVGPIAYGAFRSISSPFLGLRMQVQKVSERLLYFWRLYGDTYDFSITAGFGGGYIPPDVNPFLPENMRQKHVDLREEVRLEQMQRRTRFEDFVTNDDGSTNWERIFGRPDPDPFVSLEKSILSNYGISGLEFTFALDPEAEQRFIESVEADPDVPMWEHVRDNENIWAEMIGGTLTDVSWFLGPAAIKVLYPEALVLGPIAEKAMGLWREGSLHRGILALSARSRFRGYSDTVTDLWNKLAISWDVEIHGPVFGGTGKEYFQRALLDPEAFRSILAPRQMEELRLAATRLGEADLMNIGTLLKKYGALSGMIEVPEGGNMIARVLELAEEDPKIISSLIVQALEHLEMERLGITSRPRGSLKRAFEWVGRFLKENWLGPNIPYHMVNTGDDSLRMIAAGYAGAAFDTDSAATIGRYLGETYGQELPSNVARAMIMDALDVGLPKPSGLATADLPWPIGGTPSIRTLWNNIADTPLPDRIDDWTNGTSISAWILRNVNYAKIPEKGLEIGQALEAARRARLLLEAYEVDLLGKRIPLILQAMSSDPSVPPSLPSSLENGTVRAPNDFDKVEQRLLMETGSAEIIAFDRPLTVPRNDFSDQFAERLLKLQETYDGDLDNPLFQEALERLFDRAQVVQATRFGDQLRAILGATELPAEVIQRTQFINDIWVKTGGQGIIQDELGAIYFGPAAREFLAQQPQGTAPGIYYEGVWYVGTGLHAQAADIVARTVGVDRAIVSTSSVQIIPGPHQNFVGYDFVDFVLVSSISGEDYVTAAQGLIDIGVDPSSVVLIERVAEDDYELRSLAGLAGITEFEAPTGATISFDPELPADLQPIALKEAAQADVEASGFSVEFDPEYTQAQLNLAQAGILPDNVVLGKLFEDFDADDIALIAEGYLAQGPEGLKKAYYEAVALYNEANYPYGGGIEIADRLPTSAPQTVPFFDLEFDPQITQMTLPDILAEDFPGIKGVYTPRGEIAFTSEMHDQAAEALGIHRTSEVLKLTIVDDVWIFEGNLIVKEDAASKLISLGAPSETAVLVGSDRVPTTLGELAGVPRGELPTGVQPEPRQTEIDEISTQVLKGDISKEEGERLIAELGITSPEEFARRRRDRAGVPTQEDFARRRLEAVGDVGQVLAGVEPRAPDAEFLDLISDMSKRMVGLFEDGEIRWHPNALVHGQLGDTQTAANWITDGGQIIGFAYEDEQAFEFLRALLDAGVDPRMPVDIRVQTQGTEPIQGALGEVAEGTLGPISETIHQGLAERRLLDYRTMTAQKALEDFQMMGVGFDDWRQRARGISERNSQNVSRSREQLEDIKDAVRRYKAQYLEAMDNATVYGISETNRVLFDYGAKTEAEEILRYYSPFTTWQLRNPLFWAQAFSRNPGLISLAYRMWHALEQDRKRKDLTSRFKGSLGFELEDEFLGFPPGYYSADVTSILGVFNQFQEPFEAPGAEEPTGWAKIVKDAVNLGRFGGIRPWPWIDLGLQAADVFPREGVGEVFGPVQRAIGLAGRAAGAQPPEGVTRTSQWLFSYYTRRRISEMEAEGLIDHAAALDALSTEGGEAWADAQEFVLGVQTRLGTLSLVQPFNVKFASPGELTIRELQGQELSALDRDEFPFLETYGLSFGTVEDAQRAQIYFKYEQLLEGVPLGSAEYSSLLSQRQAEIEEAGFAQVSPPRDVRLPEPFAGFPQPRGESDVPPLMQQLGEMTSRDLMFELNSARPRPDQFTFPSGDINWEQYNERLDQFNDSVPEFSHSVGAPISREEWERFQDRYSSALDIAYDIHRDRVSEAWDRFDAIRPGGPDFGNAVSQYSLDTYRDALASGMYPDDAAAFAAEEFKEALARGLPFDEQQKYIDMSEATDAEQYTAEVATRMGLRWEDIGEVAAELEGQEFPGMFGPDDAQDRVYNYYFNLTSPEQRKVKTDFGVPEGENFARWFEVLSDDEKSNFARQVQARAQEIPGAREGYLNLGILKGVGVDYFLPPNDALTTQEQEDIAQLERDWWLYNKAREEGRGGFWTGLMEQYHGDVSSGQGRFWDALNQYALASAAFNDPVLSAAMDRIARGVFDFTEEQYEEVTDYFLSHLDRFVDQEKTQVIRDHPDWMDKANLERNALRSFRLSEFEDQRADYFNIPSRERSDWEKAHPEEWSRLEPYLALRRAEDVGRPYYLYFFVPWEYKTWYGNKDPDTLGFQPAILREKLLSVIENLEAWRAGTGPWTATMEEFIGPDPADPVITSGGGSTAPPPPPSGNGTGSGTGDGLPPPEDLPPLPPPPPPPSRFLEEEPLAFIQ